MDILIIVAFISVMILFWIEINEKKGILMKLFHFIIYWIALLSVSILFFILVMYIFTRWG